MLIKTLNKHRTRKKIVIDIRKYTLAIIMGLLYLQAQKLSGCDYKCTTYKHTDPYAGLAGTTSLLQCTKEAISDSYFSPSRFIKTDDVSQAAINELDQKIKNGEEISDFFEQYKHLTDQQKGMIVNAATVVTGNEYQETRLDHTTNNRAMTIWNEDKTYVCTIPQNAIRIAYEAYKPIFQMKWECRYKKALAHGAGLASILCLASDCPYISIIGTGLLASIYLPLSASELKCKQVHDDQKRKYNTAKGNCETLFNKHKACHSINLDLNELNNQKALNKTIDGNYVNDSRLQSSQLPYVAMAIIIGILNDNTLDQNKKVYNFKANPKNEPNDQSAETGKNLLKELKLKTNTYYTAPAYPRFNKTGERFEGWTDPYSPEGVDTSIPQNRHFFTNTGKNENVILVNQGTKLDYKQLMQNKSSFKWNDLIKGTKKAINSDSCLITKYNYDHICRNRTCFYLGNKKYCTDKEKWITHTPSLSTKSKPRHNYHSAKIDLSCCNNKRLCVKYITAKQRNIVVDDYVIKIAPNDSETLCFIPKKNPWENIKEEEYGTNLEEYNYKKCSDLSEENHAKTSWWRCPIVPTSKPNNTEQ